MATRRVPVLPQTGRPGQIDNELIDVQARVARLAYDAGHMGASTMPDTFLPNTADFTGSLSSTAKLYQLLGVRLPFICRSLGCALKTAASGVCRFGVYQLSRNELDSTGLVRAVKVAETGVIAPAATWADFKLDLDREVAITPDSIWFIGAVSAVSTVDIPGINFSNGVLGRPASTVFSAAGAADAGGTAALPGVLGPVVDAGAGNVSVTNLVDDFQQAPDDVDRNIILVHALSRTAERLSWNAY